MNCREVKGLLSPYLDGALAPARSQAVERHLASCPECRAEFEALQATVALVKGLEPVAPPAGFAASVEAVVRRETVRKADRRRSAPRLRALPGWARGLAVAAAVLVVGVALASLLNLVGVVGPGLALPGDKMTLPGREVGVAPVPPAADFGAGTPAKEGGGGTPATEAPGRAAGPQPALGAPAVPQAGGGLLPYYEHKVIRSADMALRVENIDDGYRRVVMITQAVKGFVEQSNLATAGEGEKAPRTASFLLRVPSDMFDRVLDDLSRVGEVLRLSQTGQDVSQEYYDLQSRIRNAQRQEERLLEILGRAETVDEILRVEQEIARVRGDIEVMQGRSNYLDQMVALSSIQVYLEEKSKDEKPPAPPDIWNRMWKALRSTLVWLGRAGSWVAVFLAGAVPLLVVLALAWLAWRRWRRTR